MTIRKKLQKKVLALALESLGGNHRYNTPVYRQGAVTNSVLDGNLVLVASGDFTMGGRRGPNGTLALMNIAVNKVGPFEEFSDTIPLLQDIDTIPAIWWREL